MKLNTTMKSSPIKTHAGAVAKRLNPELQLRRLVMSTMLWEDQFYVDGLFSSKQIQNLIPKVDPFVVANIAIEARSVMKLRHIPLLITREMARLDSHKRFVKDILIEIIQRPDELTEFLAIYWKDERQPLSAQVKKGLAKAFTKFDEYSLAKYSRDSQVKLKDVLFLTHAKPKDAEQADLWKRLIDDKLKTPDTWEVSLSEKNEVSKHDKWTRLLNENKLGALALLRNLRNMSEANVDKNLIIKALNNMKVERVLPFRFIAASRYMPSLESYLEKAMFKCLEGHKKFKGETVLLVDVSGSMSSKISGKSDMSRFEAACALAMLTREISENVRIFTFSNTLVEVPNRRGFALRDAIMSSQPRGGTWLGKALNCLYGIKQTKGVERFNWGWNRDLKPLNLRSDRLIIFTDEQSHDKVPDPKGLGYMINVASYKNGVGYGPWNHVDGFSEKVIDYIQNLEEINL